MALPLIIINSTGGHDTQASGAGPATALYGSNAVSAADGLSVTLATDNPDLSGVATDGSAVLFFNDTNAGSKNFVKITNVDNATKVVTLTPALRASQTKGWAIGGKRSAISTTLSKKLFDNNGGAGDAQAGWIIEMQSGHSETVAARIDVRCAGGATTGRIILRGESGAATRPVLTKSGTGDIVPRTDYFTFQDFDTTLPMIGTASVVSYIGVKSTGPGSGDAFNNPGAQSQFQGCEITGWANGITGSMQSGHIIGNYIHGLTGDAIVNDARDMSGWICFANVINDCGSDGIVMTQNRSDGYGSMKVLQNVINDCGGDGIRYVSLAASMAGLMIVNNSISACGAYGINLSNAGADAVEINAYRPIILNNNTYGSGTANFHLGDGTTADGTINVGDSHIDPAYTNVAGEDFTSAALADLGFPQILANL